MSVPKYKTIENELKHRIENGTYPMGSIIPKEMELAAEFNVSRPTVRQAVQELVNQGLLEKKRKRGTMVCQTKIAQEFTHIIKSYDEEMHEKGLTTSTKVLEFSTLPADEHIAKHLQIEPGAIVYKLVRLRFADEEPVVLVTTYVPLAPIPALATVNFAHASLYAELARHYLPVTRVRRRLEVTSASRKVADLLHVSKGAPLFYFHTYGYTITNLLMEYSIAQYRGDINYFEFEIDH
ncbi:GntR family transcriptional regulator [Lacticaseibacillus hulanensis]|uniref:GntR family transcriptional regulator n=1 Tax=Lacticaseibacillus hulanensis TaxID=2493111 RepID=UPI000FDA65CF|nr:GntR family transcriptional regulator [Lacticaseibacillus hulanensis]